MNTQRTGAEAELAMAGLEATICGDLIVVERKVIGEAGGPYIVLGALEGAGVPWPSLLSRSSRWKLMTCIIS